ncbi:hypothetical protein [Aporhodopirellula aestuarii]|uniref:Uncharacterized protein n=1 Tax=Aporhodopirellula aestuarii TaxID=2950107 RepID=A0ABT0U0T1_9BACT|nr:hypothetical protein [Aporhodopirellula aestuarii]MCM2370467.1 hypothetical protein [Aporhodopirellula aestuarii]
MPDNWNILASLLGTPRPPEPAEVKQDDPQVESEPAEKEVAAETTPDAAETASPEQSEASDSSRSSLRSAHSAPSSESDSSEPDSSESDLDVLEALTAVQPPPKLPGFGIPDDEPSVTPAKAETASFASAEAEIKQRESQLSAGRSSRSSSETRQHTASGDTRSTERSSGRPPRRSGFADGLGVVSAEDDDDLLDEPFGFVDEDDDAEAEDDSPSATTSSPASRGERSTGRGDDKSKADSPSRGNRDDSPREAQPPRGRGRRGQRQRMSEDDLAGMSVGESTSSGPSREQDTAPADNDSRSRSRGRSRRGGGRDEENTSEERGRGGRGRSRDRDDDFGVTVVAKESSETPERDSDTTESPRRSRRGRGRGRGDSRRGERESSTQPAARTREPVLDDEDDSDVGFAADLFDDLDSVDTSDDFGVESGAARSSSRGDSDDEDGPRAGRRSRRGGRRRGRRGAGSAESGDTETAARASKPSDELPRSAFDDDLEDDDEIETIRRGQTAAESSDRGRKDDDSGQDRPRRGGRGRGRDRDSRDRDSRDRDSRSDVSAAGQDFPTWHTIVNAMVDKNLSGRRGGGGGGPRGGGSSGGGRGNTSNGSRGRRR